MEPDRAGTRQSLSGPVGGFLCDPQEGHTPIANPTGTVAHSRQPWDYDRRVPILFWRHGLSGATVEQPIETADIMPTLAAQLGLPLTPGLVDGRCLGHVAGCPAGTR